jgi:signal transduction histidine kinase
MILTEAARLLMSAPGSLVYHLTLVTSLAVVYSLARIHHTSNPSQLSYRLSNALGTLLILRIIVMLITAVSWAFPSETIQLLPPLDRFSNVAGIALFGWALLDIQPDSGLNFALSILLGLGLLGVLVTLAFFPDPQTYATFNASSSDAVWSLSGLGIALLISFTLTTRRPPEWVLGLIGFNTMIAGYALHMTLGPKEGSLAGFIRWAELLAYPLLAVAAARGLAPSDFALEEYDREIPSPSVQVRSSPYHEIMAEMATLISVTDLKHLAATIVKSIGTSMRVEICSLLTPPDSMGRFSIATAYDLIRDHHLPGAALDRSSCPVMYAALNRQRVMRLPAGSKSPDLITLQEKFNLDSTGPSLMVPIAAEGDVLGGILLLSPYTHRPWFREDLRALEQVASHLAQRIRQINRLLSSPESSPLGEKVMAELKNLIKNLEEKFSQLKANLRSIPDQDEMTQMEQLSALLRSNEEALAIVQVLDAEFVALKEAMGKTDLDKSPTGSGPGQDEYQMVVRELHEVRAQLAAAEARRATPEGSTTEIPQDIQAIVSIAQEMEQRSSSIAELSDLLLGETVGELGATQREFMEQVQTASKAIQAQINDLLQIAAIEPKTVQPSSIGVDLLECMDEAVTQAGETLREKHLALRMDFPPDMPLIAGEKESIVQIANHLLNNAIGVSPDGDEIILAVRIQEAEEADFALLTVSDAGEGIPAEDISRVFMPVNVADYEPITGLGESGMGLSIVKALSEAIGGRVWFDSELGVGSTFTVLLPVLKE